MVSRVSFRLAGGASPLHLVPVRVNDHGPFDFILDTGASTSLLSPALARRLSVRTAGSRKAVGAGGPVEVSLATVESLAVGTARREGLAVAITDDVARIGAAVGARVEGDLGYDFLSAYRVTLDYRDATLCLADSGEAKVYRGRPSGHSEVPFQLANPGKPLVVVPVKLEGRGPYRFAVDTGSSATLIHRALAQELSLPLTVAPAMTGGGGKVDALAGTLRSLCVGSQTLAALPIVATRMLERLSNIVGSRLDGILGYSFLKHFRVTIDYPASTLSLER